MKALVLIFSLLLSIPVASAHSANIKGYKDKNSKYISYCNKKYYGYHKKDGQNHWHEVTFKKERWEIINPKEKFITDPCYVDSKEKVSFIKCVDGDTAIFKKEDKEVKFRFLAVDTPESVHPKKEVEAYAKEASKNTCDLLTNANTIEVEYDSNSDKTDKYGRNLAWIWIDGILLQELMVSEGFARVAYIYGDYKYVDSLCSIQAQAIESNKGIWQYGYDIGYCDTTNLIAQNIETSNVYVVTFNDGDKSEDVTVAEGMSINQKDPEGKVGYKFVGWYHNNKPYNFNSPVTASITLTAKYKADYIYIILVVLFVTVGILGSMKGDKNGKNY